MRPLLRLIKEDIYSSDSGHGNTSRHTLSCCVSVFHTPPYLSQCEIPGQEFMYFADGMLSDACDDGAEIGFRVNGIKLGGFDEGVHATTCWAFGMPTIVSGRLQLKWIALQAGPTVQAPSVPPITTPTTELRFWMACSNPA